MAQLRLALAQINPTVGDIDGNSALVLRWTRHAAEQGAHVVAFPEMALTGYPVEDLALRRSFQDASRAAVRSVAEQLAAEGLGDPLVVLGYLDGAPDAVPVLGKPAGAPQNAAAFLHGGTVVGR
ncbi:MAG: nitrilase-related carbon-nitrogen hydrolase, partial [Actinomycetes bacterium]